MRGLPMRAAIVHRTTSLRGEMYRGTMTSVRQCGVTMPCGVIVRGDVTRSTRNRYYTLRNEQHKM